MDHKKMYGAGIKKITVWRGRERVFCEEETRSLVVEGD